MTRLTVFLATAIGTVLFAVLDWWLSAAALLAVGCGTIVLLSGAEDEGELAGTEDEGELAGTEDEGEPHWYGGWR